VKRTGCVWLDAVGELEDWARLRNLVESETATSGALFCTLLRTSWIPACQIINMCGHEEVRADHHDQAF
jgi:hypothetical protein